MVLLSIIWMGSPIRIGNKRKIFAIIDVIIHLLSFFHSYFTDQERFSEIGSTGTGSGWWWLAASLKSTDFGFGWQLPNTTWETLWIAIICQSKLHQHVFNHCMGVLDIKLILRASSFIVSQEYRALGDVASILTINSTSLKVHQNRVEGSAAFHEHKNAFKPLVWCVMAYLWWKRYFYADLWVMTAM